MSGTKTIERIAAMEIKLENIKETQEKQSKDNKDAHNKIFSKLDNFIQSADNKYATKSELKEKTDNISDNIKTASKWSNQSIIYILMFTSILVSVISVIVSYKLRGG